MPKFGLIGDPISHSCSPALFKAAYRGKYEYELIEGKYFEEVYSRFLRSYQAINVTAPFKEDAYEKADIVSGPCALANAANILVKGAEGVACYNSDFTAVILTVAESYFPGIIREFYGEFGVNAHKKIHLFLGKILPQLFNGRKARALVAGCGGAGRAAAIAAAEMGFETVVLNRSIDKVEAFSKSLPEYKFRIGGIESFAQEAGKSDLIVYALPVALDCLDNLSSAELGDADNRLLLEANYRRPSITGIRLARFADAGFTYVGGKGWLVNQGVSGYSLMTSEVPDIEAMMSMEI